MNERICHFCSQPLPIGSGAICYRGNLFCLDLARNQDCRVAFIVEENRKAGAA